MLNRVQAHPLRKRAKERRGLVRLIFAQEPISKMGLQMRPPDLPVTIDRRGLFVGAHPRQVNGFHEFIDGQKLLRLVRKTVRVNCSHEPSRGLLYFGRRRLSSCGLRSKVFSRSLSFKFAANVALFPIAHVPLPRAKNDATFLLPSHCDFPFFSLLTELRSALTFFRASHD